MMRKAKKMIALLLTILLFASCSEKKPSVVTESGTSQTEDSSVPPAKTEPPVSPKEDIKPENPVSEEYRLLFSEEFDGPLDLSVWSYRTGTRLGSENRAANVTVSDGWLQITCRIESDGTRTCGGIITRELFGYGYYETKVRLYTAGCGVHTSFWSMGGTGTEPLRAKQNTVFELDGFEFDSDTPGLIQFNLNYKVGEKRGLIEKKAVPSVSGRDVIVGYEWLPDRVNWYMDGKLIHTVTDADDPIHYAQQAVWLTALLTDEMTGKMDADPLPGKSSFDYFRFYAMPLEGINVIGASEFEYNENEGFAASYPLSDPMAWAISGTTGAATLLRTQDAYAGNYVLAMKSPNQNPYAASAIQQLYYLPDGTYDCSVMVKAPGFSGNASLSVETAEGKRTVAISSCEAWTEVRIPDIPVSGGKAKLSISCSGSKEDALFIDNPSLCAQSGISVQPAAPFLPALPASAAGVTVFDTTSDNYKEYGGEWKTSSIVGMEHKSRYRLKTTADTRAEWTVTFPADSEMLLEIGVPATAQNISAAVTVTVSENGQEIFRSSGGGSLRENTWVAFGTISVRADAVYTVTITAGRIGATLRTDAVRFTSSDSFSLSDRILFPAGGGKTIVNGVRLAINNAPAAILDGEVAYLDAEWLSSVLGMELKGNRTENGRAYISSEEITAQTGEYTVTVADGRFILLSPELPPTMSQTIIAYFESCFR